MWQRIQTLFLSIAILFNIAIFFTDIATFNFNEQVLSFGIYGLNTDNVELIHAPIYWLAVLCTASILLSLIIIFNYKKRNLQIKIAQANLLVHLGFIVGLFFALENAVEMLSEQGLKMIPDYGLGAYLSLIPLIFIFLAIRNIKKDEALVRAADRIR